MSDPTIYGLVGHKIAKASSNAVLGNSVDKTAQFPPRTTVLFQDDGTLYQAIYVYVGQTASGSAILAVNASGTASVSASGYVAMMSAGVQAVPGEYIWIRSSSIAQLTVTGV